MSKNNEMNNENLEKKAKLLELHEDAEIILEAAAVAQKVLKDERYIVISNSQAVPTILYEAMKALIAVIAKHKSTDKDLIVNFAHLFDIGVSYQESEDGEKDGNFVPVLMDGQIMRTLVKSDEATELDG